MNKKIYLSLILLFFFQTTFSQKINNGIITYTVNLDLNKKKLDSIEKLNPFIYTVLKNQKPQKGILKFNNYESNWQKTSKLGLDNKVILDLISIRMNGTSLYYTNLSDKKGGMQQEFDEKKYIVTYKLPKWELTNKSKKIGKYNVYEAISYQTKITTKSKETFKVSAWFCPEIPISFGPKEYSGLPGLILELIYEGLIFSVEKIELNKNNITIKEPIKGEKISRKSYDAILQKASNKMKNKF